MAKDTQPQRPKPKRAKTRWFKTIAEVFTFVRKNDPVFLPVFIGLVVLISGGGLTLGFMGGSITSHIYANLAATLLLVVAMLALLTNRIDKARFNQVEGTLGASLAAVQTIRRGWKFEETPVEVDPKGQAVVFQGVGRGGIALVAEGGPRARKLVQTARSRLIRIVPGVPVAEFYTGKAHGDLTLRGLVKAVKGLKRVLSKREREAIEKRIHALGGTRLAAPKGIDPSRARPDRKAMRGR